MTAGAGKQYLSSKSHRDFHEFQKWKRWFGLTWRHCCWSKEFKLLSIAETKWNLIQVFLISPLVLQLLDYQGRLTQNSQQVVPDYFYFLIVRNFGFLQQTTFVLQMHESGLSMSASEHILFLETAEFSPVLTISCGFTLEHDGWRRLFVWLRHENSNCRSWVYNHKSDVMVSPWSIVATSEPLHL